jgi:hypothetical protein
VGLRAQLNVSDSTVVTCNNHNPTSFTWFFQISQGRLTALAQRSTMHYMLDVNSPSAMAIATDLPFVTVAASSAENNDFLARKSIASFILPPRASCSRTKFTYHVDCSPILCRSTCSNRDTFMSIKTLCNGLLVSARDPSDMKSHS